MQLHSLTKATSILLATTILLAIPVGAEQTQPAAPAKKASPAQPPGQPEKKARPIPFNGKIKAVDMTARTITVGSRVFKVLPETKLMNRNKTPVTLQAGIVGDSISGSYRKAEDGQLIANSVYFGPKPEPGASVAPVKK